ncbi:hypothetical protein CDES_08705 [Corynebacterium deserti GIMN1.010]|uniref:Uncharacterized protein n=1 Tax=Corynebacterium deserti GIMN1.010 TaxID=931089 RepID=A0A0M3Q9T0_9CORY|nr:hypothetical protein [Corynebacterium deserti]ALC06133.1 hypothetical protein CDES_08705 [Corynebacterium deserti GIMN1.010]
MEHVNATLIIMSGSPALIPEMAPADKAGARLLHATRRAVGECIDARDVELVGSQSDQWYTAHTGSLKAWGAPEIEVSGGHHLAEIVQRYVLGSFESRVANTRGKLGEINPFALTLVSVDGPTGLTARAPSALVPGAQEMDAWCRTMLQGSPGQVPSKKSLIDASVREPDLWLELATLAPHVIDAELVDADDTHGVGRYLARWTFGI